MEPIIYDMSHTIFSIVSESGKTQVKWNYNLLTPEYLEPLRVIHSVYDISYFIWLNKNRNKIKPKRDRVCRFCGKSYPEVKFSTIAHTFPEGLGNKNHISDSECDDCNHKFGTYETDLMNFLGPFRTLAEITGKNGVPKFKSRDKKLSLEQASKDALDIKLSSLGFKNKVIEKEDGSGLLIQVEGDPYTPINVFKSLLKTSISLVDPDDLSYLTNSIKFLMDNEFKTDPSHDFIFTIHKFFIPGNFNVPPFLIQYKKGKGFIDLPAPSLVFIFYIRNLIIQLFIPFHDNDSILYSPTVERHLYIVPPLINGQWCKKYGGPFPSFTNLNDNNVLKNNIQVFEWKYTR